MKIGESISVSGYITKEKFIAGRTLAEVEKILGFHPGRLSQGMAMAVLMELPVCNSLSSPLTPTLPRTTIKSHKD